MFELEGLISRENLYICAKAMGGWSQAEGEYPVYLLIFGASRGPNAGARSKTHRRRQ